MRLSPNICRSGARAQIHVRTGAGTPVNTRADFGYPRGEKPALASGSQCDLNETYFTH